MMGYVRCMRTYRLPDSAHLLADGRDVLTLQLVLLDDVVTLGLHKEHVGGERLGVCLPDKAIEQTQRTV